MMKPFEVSPELAKIGGRIISREQWVICQRVISEGKATDGNEAYRLMLIEVGKLAPDSPAPGAAA